jgi:hypothetical protein
VDLAGLATVAVSAVGVPFIVLASVVLGGPNSVLKLPLPSLPVPSPITTAAPQAPAAPAIKLPGLPALSPPAFLKKPEAPAAPRPAKVKAAAAKTSADLKAKAAGKADAARKAEKAKRTELEAKLKVLLGGSPLA